MPLIYIIGGSGKFTTFLLSLLQIGDSQFLTGLSLYSQLAVRIFRDIGFLIFRDFIWLLFLSIFNSLIHFSA